MNLNSETILNYLVEKDDFNFEIKVLKSGIDSRFKCNHGGSYNDPITNKIRQFDLQFEKHFENFHIYLAIECKNLRPKNPILLSQTPRQMHESFHELIISKITKRDGSRTEISDFLKESFVGNKSKSIRISKDNKLYPYKNFVGKSIIQSGFKQNEKPNGKNEEIYDKWIQAFGQGQSLLNKAASIYNTNNLKLNLSAIFPILVIPNNCLWIVNYNLDGNIDSIPKLCDSGELYFSIENTFTDKFPDLFNFSHLNIYTYNGFINFLNKLEKGSEFLEYIFPEEDIIEQLKSHDA